MFHVSTTFFEWCPCFEAESIKMSDRAVFTNQRGMQQRILLRKVLRKVLETTFEKVLRRVLRRCPAMGFSGKKGSEKGS